MEPTFFVTSAPTTEGSEVLFTFQRIPNGTANTDLKIRVNYVPSGITTDESKEATAADFAVPKEGTIVTIPAGFTRQTLSLSTFADQTFEGLERMPFRFTDATTGYVHDHEVQLLESMKSVPVPTQRMEITFLDSEIKVTEGQTAVLRMSIKGNTLGGDIQLPFDMGGGQIMPNSDFTKTNLRPNEWYVLRVEPGQTYAEFRMNMVDDQMRENDKRNVFGTVKEGSLSDFGSYYFANTVAVTLTDNDWGTASAPSGFTTVNNITINGNNNTVNAPVTNTTIVNSGTMTVDGRQYYDLRGTTGDDKLSGTATDDYGQGGDGTDTITGNDGNDTLLGNIGNDYLEGNIGNDMLFGGQGDDMLFGGQNADVLVGGKGNDLLVGGKGHDILTGGEGADKFVLAPGFDTIKDFNFAEGDRILYTGERTFTFGMDEQNFIQIVHSTGTTTLENVTFANFNPTLAVVPMM